MSNSMLRIPLILFLLTLPLHAFGAATTANTFLAFSEPGGFDHLTVADDPTLNPTEAITIETWCLIPGPFNDASPIILKAEWFIKYIVGQYGLTMNGQTAKIGFGLGLDGGSVGLSSGPGGFTFGEWFHVAATYDGSMMRLFIDGVEVDSGPASGSITTRSCDVIIGSHFYYTHAFVGRLDDMRLWNIARTHEEILDGMCTPPDGDETGLMAAWDFDDGAGVVATDRSPNGNDAEFGGSHPEWVDGDIPDCPDLDIDVVIDVKPGSDDNPIACEASDKKNVVPVALLTTADFDALSVDHATVRFGPAGTPEAHANHRGPIRHEEDVDRDGDLDLVFHFMVGSSGIMCGDTSVELVGETWDGQTIVGSDLITTKSRERKPGKEGDGITLSPNPFNPRTTVSFALVQGSDVRVTVHDIRGRLVARLADQSYGAGSHSVVWSGRDTSGRAAPSGQYFFMIQIDDTVEIRKALLMK